MGLTVIEVEIANPARPDRFEKIEMIVDSGAGTSVVPRDLLERLGIRPFGRKRYTVADGSGIYREHGCALFRYGGETAGSETVFGKRRDMALLGVTALEELGFALDPIHRTLIRVPMIIARVA